MVKKKKKNKANDKEIKRLCPLVNNPCDECYCYNMTSQNIIKVQELLYGDI